MTAIAVLILAVTVLILVVEVARLRRRVDFLAGRVLVLDNERAHVRIELLNLRNGIRRHEVVFHDYPPPPRHRDDGPQGHRTAPLAPDSRQYLPDMPG